MSASQQAQNKKLHKLIDQLESQIDRYKAENDRLRELIPQAWAAGQNRMSVGINGNHTMTLREWMKQKGLA